MKEMRSVLHDILDQDLTSGEVLRGLRIKENLSQDELEEITGVATAHLTLHKISSMQARHFGSLRRAEAKTF